MAHLLIIDLPGGNDADIIEAAIARGDEFTFLSSQLALYRRQPQVWALLAAARELIEVPGFADAEVDARVRAAHARCRIDAVLCLIDIRLIEAARLAQQLGTRYLNLASATLLRDKASVRRRLAERGIAQPEFALAESAAELEAAVQKIGLPVLIKPADGYGSQNIVVLRSAMDLDPLLSPLPDMLPSRADYGLGVMANDRLLVERYMTGTFYGVDTMTANGVHSVVGVHRKLMFEPPSFAMRGSTFSARDAASGEEAQVERYALSLLDAVGFDWGATHIELMLTASGPQLIEINPRLVGAKMPRLVGHTLRRSQHDDLIALHLGLPVPPFTGGSTRVGVIRWIVAAERGRLDEVRLPAWSDERIRSVEILRQRGDPVGQPFENADRIGCVMVCGSSRHEAEALADRYVAQTVIALQAAAPAQAELQEEVQAEVQDEGQAQAC
jgi:biotin carboxylase